MKKVGIFGGSFCPIHNGHLQIAQDCLDSLCLDKVLFIPNANPPHRDIDFFSFDDRVNMIELAISNNQKFEVSLVEKDSSKVNYSYNTLKDNFLSDDTKLCFIMGDDEFLNIRSWYKYEQFLEMCCVVVFLRSFDKKYVIEKNKEIFEKYEVELMDNTVVSISSTKIRDRLNKKESVKYVLPKEVSDYLYTKMDYFDIAKIKTDLKNKLSLSRYEHSLRVADFCKKLASIYEVDENKAYIAGLVHDCAKGLEEYYMLNKKLSSDIIFDKEESVNFYLQHSSIGAVVAKRIYGIDDEGILSAIRFHTTAKENMSMLEKILFISDKVELGRSYPRVDELRRIVIENIDMAIIEFLKDNFKFLVQKNQSIHSRSLKALKYLESKR
ncbi:MAG: nicotinate (nicotinamide) nucleotide adenylyltransferase [Peptoniphilaceae bacterium]|uniref:nicotinate (nicotinamide) nucleotide adenylyltransferase n=1 Tax=Parvimonas sp. TaxID=1944660 RepID=UPI0025E9344C|nr:nicotinate (nicotinamide) nucleotide adenylyltransferase [Parvimonas sp.]MCI5997704.1 nicotinate (nicotinamide) nucleotide adenylyltransferase [Parvimonas sp.]MDD7765558.1 nicotinate (nicotinamide) nucleotide adenylyltransferase [Peptoniphilaceae bacterium]MDY3051099.1 nicotinate (nicotinamide) nucleotide adenylyltransferase [Parvimonas sp.]